MKTYSSHRSESVLLDDAAMHAAGERECQSKLLVDIAEIDARRVYREAGYDSIHSYCVAELGLSEKAAFHRIWVARLAWKFPYVLAALAEGRLHQTAVAMLATYVSHENVEELVEAAANRTKVEVAQLLAERFPKQDLFVSAAAAKAADLPPTATESARITPEESQQVTPVQHPPEGVGVALQAAGLAMLPERFPLKVGLKRETHEKLRRAQDLLGHVIPSGDVAEVLDRALDVLIRKLEKRKFAAADRPRRCQSNSRSGRTISADVRRAVRERDGDRCAFVSEKGTRCPARRRLEYDHIQPLARGGQSTVGNVRLLCRAHNQLMAELALGREFVKGRIEQARDERIAAKTKAAEQAQAMAAQLVTGLRRLGFGAEESKRAVEDFAGDPAAMPEARMRAALAYLVPTRPRPPFSEQSAIAP